MRVLLGLTALVAAASSVNAVALVTLDASTGNTASPSIVGASPLVNIFAYQTSNGGTQIPAASIIGTPNMINVADALPSTSNWQLTVPNTVTTIVFKVSSNTYTAQMQYRWSPNYALGLQYTCDPCASACSTDGPGALLNGVATPTSGFPCANLVRIYTMSGLVASTSAAPTSALNSFSVQVFDRQTSPAPNTTSYSFGLLRSAPVITGDPQIVGLQGQDFQVHGIPDEIFNMISAPALQINARFVYLSSAECHDNFTACFAHPGTYISEEGIRIGNDKVYVKAGSFKKGLSVKINGQKVTKKTNELKLGAVEILNHRRVLITTPLATVQISNSDMFLNQETALHDSKLIELGRERRRVLVGESFHPEVPLHGLQGQTWRNVEYPSGLDYEGTIADYQIADGNLFGTHFVFNKYQL